tara:strand:+ start:799 stop:1056 length:258 start_codon:yes stop_codon:yes gene_type:complete
VKQVAILYQGKKPSYPKTEGMEYTYIKNPWHVHGVAFDSLIVDDLTIDKSLVKQAMSYVRGNTATHYLEGEIRQVTIEGTLSYED